MHAPALLEGERQSGVIWYKSFRQSPKHPRWALERGLTDLSPASRYHYYRTARVLAATLGHTKLMVVVYCRRTLVTAEAFRIEMR